MGALPALCFAAGLAVSRFWGGPPNLLPLYWTPGHFRADIIEQAPAFD